MSKSIWLLLLLLYGCEKNKANNYRQTVSKEIIDLCNGLYLLRLKKQTHQAVVERVIIKAESKDISAGKPFPDSDYLFESNNDSDQGLICIYNNEQQVYYFKNGKSIMGGSLEEIINDITEKYNSRIQG